MALLLSCSGPQVVPEIPRPEHPRPQFQRADWLTLNGPWEFRFDDLDEGVAGEWWKPAPSGSIAKSPCPSAGKASFRAFTIPADIRSAGIGAQIDVPGGWSEPARLAALRGRGLGNDGVGQRQRGRAATKAATRRLRSTSPITSKPGETATVVVRVFDPTDRNLPTGKQVARWYTFTSGIWQTVWLEARPATYVSRLSLVPQNRRRCAGRCDVSLEAAGPDGTANVRVSSPDSSVAPQQGAVNLRGGSGTFRKRAGRSSNPQLWSPDDPQLYDLHVELSGAARARRMRSTPISACARSGAAATAICRTNPILLNGKPVYLRGALDQSFNPRGIYTAPNDEFLKHDMELAKSLGLNFLRIHIKPDEPRRLYWADKLGVLIMQDMPNTWEQNPRARQAWEATMRGVIERDRNHPAIIAWCLFNETWGLGSGRDYGQDYAQRPGYAAVGAFDVARGEGAPRPDAAGRGQLGRQARPRQDRPQFLALLHRRLRAGAGAHRRGRREHARRARRSTTCQGYEQDTAPLINSEYGAVSAGGGDRDISWGFRYLTTQLRRHEKIQGYIYTELTDIEFEHNGFFNYDRSPKEFGYDAFAPGMTVADLQGRRFRRLRRAAGDRRRAGRASSRCRFS